MHKENNIYVLLYVPYKDHLTTCPSLTYFPYSTIQSQDYLKYAYFCITSRQYNLE